MYSTSIHQRITWPKPGIPTALRSDYVYSQDVLAELLHGIRSNGATVEGEFPCFDCEYGEYEQVGGTSPNGMMTYECDSCGNKVTFP